MGFWRLRPCGKQCQRQRFRKTMMWISQESRRRIEAKLHQRQTGRRRLDSNLKIVCRFGNMCKSRAAAGHHRCWIGRAKVEIYVRLRAAKFGGDIMTRRWNDVCMTSPSTFNKLPKRNFVTIAAMSTLEQLAHGEVFWAWIMIWL